MKEHESIYKKLDYFLKTKKIPNIIFHGSSGSGKKTILYNFLNKVYDYDKQKLKTNVMSVNCCHGKGIKFIREELKYFSRMNIQYNSGVIFKSIVLFNADCLTIDAQSALRRCIELFSHNTRFFMVVNNKHKLLNPILSRFCEIYIPEKYAMENGNMCFLNLHKKEENASSPPSIVFEKMLDCKNCKNKNDKYDKNNGGSGSGSEFSDIEKIIHMIEFFYQNAISALDILSVLQKHPSEFDLDDPQLNELMLYFHKTKCNFRCEKMLMFSIISKVFGYG